MTFIPIEKFESLKRKDGTPYYGEEAMKMINSLPNKGYFIPDTKQTNDMDVLPEREATERLNFGQALSHLKAGRLVARKGWNGKGMFLFIRPEFKCDLDAFHKIVSVPQNAKDKIEIAARQGLEEAMAVQFKFTAYISMFAADGSIVNGWLASQTDMLANDWQIVE